MRTQRRRSSVSEFRYTPLVAALGAALAPQVVTAATITVTNPLDSLGVLEGSLREAITIFNGTCSGADVINFGPPGVPFISTVSDPLPTITCAGLTIDGGGNQNDIASPTQLFGYGNAAFFPALHVEVPVTGTPVTIRGLNISGFTYGAAIDGFVNADSNIAFNNATGILGNTGSVISNNRVFSNTTGIYVAYGGETIEQNVAYGNSSNGIYVENVTTGSIFGNFVGVDDGSRPDLTANGSINGNSLGLYLQNSTVNVQLNVISGNDTGICLDGDLGSTVASNKIGTDVSGTSSVRNFVGIESKSPSSGSKITNNVISGNLDTAIDLEFDSGISITNNLIGTDVTGTVPLLNGSGIIAVCGSNFAIQNNVIGSTVEGVGIEFDGMTGGGALNIVGNKIGVFGDGVTPLGSNSYGVILRSGNCVLTAVAPSPTNGVLIQGNVIANSSADGVLLSPANNTNISLNTITSNGGFGVNVVSGLGNQILGNVIYGNLAYLAGGLLSKNINLGFPSSPRPLTLPDGDPTAPNDGQHYPLITSAARDGTGVTTIAFTLDTQPGTYRIDLYANTDSTGGNGTLEPGGKRLIASNASFAVAAAGGTPGTFSFADPSGLNDDLSLLVTNLSTTETSEFSAIGEVVTAPGVTVSATSIDFGNVALNALSPPLSVTLMSTGSQPYQVVHVGDGTCYGGAICAGGSFTCTTTCAPGSYATGASCQFTATFQPTVLGAFSKTIAVCDNVTPYNPFGTPSISIALTGTGVTPPPVSISPTFMDFGSQLLRIPGTPSTFTVINPGTVAASLGAPFTTEGFDILNSTCGASLAPQSSCTVSVAFDPTNVGTINGTLSVAASSAILALSAKGARLAKLAAAPLATSQLRGIGTVQAVLDLPGSIDFGAYTSGTPAIRRLVTLRNAGNAVLTLTGISTTGPFVLGNGCPLNMQPGDSCTLTLDYSASDLGIHNGTLVVLSNANGGSRTIPLTADTVAVATPLIRVSPLQIGFGNRLLGTVGAPQRVSISNVGNAPAVLSPPVVTTTDFLVTTTCGITLAPASSCFADVSLRPVGFGPRQGQLVISSNAADSPALVNLSGSGCRPFSTASSRLGASFGCLP
jgi:hypothetical protein